MKIKDLFSKVKSALGIKKKTIPAPPILTPSQPQISIIILANGQAIGAMQSVSVSERADTPVVEVKAGRVRFSRERLTEAFNKGFLSEKDQLIPLQISIIQSDTKTSVDLHNLWIDGPVGYRYESGEWIIVDGLDMLAENIDGKF
jgi:hypothetical protein